MNRLSPEQYEIIRSTVRAHGALALAAANAGIGLSRLKAAMAGDEDFRVEVEDALAEHADHLLLAAQQRAGSSDSVLIELLRATRVEFTPEGRKQNLTQTNRPQRLVLRTFDDQGQEAGVTDVAPKQQPPGAPLQIELKAGL